MKFKAQFSEKSSRTVCTRLQPDTWADLPGHCCTGNYLCSRQPVPFSSGLCFSSKLGEGATGQLVGVFFFVVVFFLWTSPLLLSKS